MDWEIDDGTALVMKGKEDWLTMAPPALLKNQSSRVQSEIASPYSVFRSAVIWRISGSVLFPWTAIAFWEISFSLAGTKMYWFWRF
jgi:hypothetical protein